MSSGSIESILSSMARVLPVFHRRLLRMDLGDIHEDLTRLHFMVMGILSEGSVSISELARIASISKSQATALIDKLVEMNVVERNPDAQDRRVINITLTEYGKRLHGDVNRKIKQSMKEKLSCLSPDELAEMSSALETLKKIGDKLQPNGR